MDLYLTKNPAKVTILREDEEFSLTAYPKTDPRDGKEKLGVWIRDSCAGIGTLTFYRPDNGKYTALGHALTDSDTGNPYIVSGGELTGASVLSVTKGKKGAPGELCGLLSNNNIIGDIQKNTMGGICGNFYDESIKNSFTAQLAPRSEVMPGKAYILSCVRGTTVEKFEIEIEKVNDSGESSSKDLLIRVTDNILIEQTGGIVQGMSGSPIIQNDKLVGAVTHVFVNDPTRGYGIFIDKMFKEIE